MSFSCGCLPIRHRDHQARIIDIASSQLVPMKDSQGVHPFEKVPNVQAEAADQNGLAGDAVKFQEIFRPNSNPGVSTSVVASEEAEGESSRLVSRKQVLD